MNFICSMLSHSIVVLTLLIWTSIGVNSTIARGGRDIMRNYPRVDNRNRNYQEIPFRSRNRCNRNIEIENGERRFRERGSLVKFNCNNGYTLVGATIAVCLRDEWSEPIPFCVRSGCRRIVVPEHAFIRPSFGGGVVYFYCDDGYRLVGSDISICNGIHWNGTEPTCQEINPTRVLAPATPRIVDETTVDWDSWDENKITHAYNNTSREITAPTEETTATRENTTTQFLQPMESRNISGSTENTDFTEVSNSPQSTPASSSTTFTTYNPKNISSSNTTSIPSQNTANISSPNITNISSSNISNILPPTISNVPSPNISNISSSNTSNISSPNISNISSSNITNNSFPNSTNTSISSMNTSNVTSPTENNGDRIVPSTPLSVHTTTRTIITITPLSKSSVTSSTTTPIIHSQNVSTLKGNLTELLKSTSPMSSTQPLTPSLTTQLSSIPTTLKPTTKMLTAVTTPRTTRFSTIITNATRESTWTTRMLIASQNPTVTTIPTHPAITPILVNTTTSKPETTTTSSLRPIPTQKTLYPTTTIRAIINTVRLTSTQRTTTISKPITTQRTFIPLKPTKITIRAPQTTSKPTTTRTTLSTTTRQSIAREKTLLPRWKLTTVPSSTRTALTTRIPVWRDDYNEQNNEVPLVPHRYTPWDKEEIKNTKGIVPNTKASKLNEDHPYHITFGHIMYIFGIIIIALISIAILSVTGLYCWRKNRGIARARSYDMDGRMLSAHDANDDFMWLENRCDEL